MSNTDNPRECAGPHLLRDGGEGDSALLAAAPELYGALKEVMSWIQNWDPNFAQDEEWPDTAIRAHAALRKAQPPPLTASRASGPQPPPPQTSGEEA